MWEVVQWPAAVSPQVALCSRGATIPVVALPWLHLPCFHLPW